MLQGIEVYEYGYAGYDLADQLHLINQYKNQFDLINHVIIGLKFEDDLTRSDYQVIPERMALEAPVYQAMRRIKLLVYLQKIGAFDAPRELTKKLFSRNLDIEVKRTVSEESSFRKALEQTYITNFKKLITAYGFDKDRFAFLLDASITPPAFLNYLKNHDFKYIDFSSVLNQSKVPTTLIYDQHWNNHGRDLVTAFIAEYIENKVCH
jgi:hypothetical protein